MMNLNLFTSPQFGKASIEALSQDTYLLANFAAPFKNLLIPALKTVSYSAPFRHMTVRGGHKMSVAMTNCGDFGWISDRNGYRYDPIDPLTEKPWPSMPSVFLELATRALILAGFDNFKPNACLINRYDIGAKMSLHQDQDELDLNHPIVSVSLGITAIFLLGGLERTDKPQRVLLQHNDVLVWGGVDRMRFHGILPVKDALHSTFGRTRINLTFRKAN